MQRRLNIAVDSSPSLLRPAASTQIPLLATILRSFPFPELRCFPVSSDKLLWGYKWSCSHSMKYGPFLSVQQREASCLPEWERFCHPGSTVWGQERRGPALPFNSCILSWDLLSMGHAGTDFPE